MSDSSEKWVGGRPMNWADEHTRFLINYRGAKEAEFKESRLKGPLWQEVTDRLIDHFALSEHPFPSNCPAAKVAGKWQELMRTYRKADSGEMGNKRWPFYRQMKAAFLNCPENDLEEDESSEPHSSTSRKSSFGRPQAAKRFWHEDHVQWLIDYRAWKADEFAEPGKKQALWEDALQSLVAATADTDSPFPADSPPSRLSEKWAELKKRYSKERCKSESTWKFFHQMETLVMGEVPYDFELDDFKGDLVTNSRDDNDSLARGRPTKRAKTDYDKYDDYDDDTDWQTGVLSGLDKIARTQVLCTQAITDAIAESTQRVIEALRGELHPAEADSPITTKIKTATES